MIAHLVRATKTRSITVECVVHAEAVQGFAMWSAVGSHSLKHGSHGRGERAVGRSISAPLPHISRMEQRWIRNEAVHREAVQPEAAAGQAH